jgi:hypothetical protein
MSSKKTKATFLVVLFSFSLIAIGISRGFWNSSRESISCPNKLIAIAGHTYGAHKGQNLGLYDKFLTELELAQNCFSDVVLNGDIVRTSTQESWTQVDQQLQKFSFNKWFVMGNHDKSEFANSMFESRFGATHYSFEAGKTKFIVLNTNEEWGRITSTQLDFFKGEISADRVQPGESVVVLMHELIWTQGKSEYVKTRHNWKTYDGKFESNYWQDLHPLMLEKEYIDFYVVAGDVSGTKKAIPASFQKVENVTFLSSGMGEGIQENYLIVDPNESELNFQIRYLNPDAENLPIESFIWTDN